MEFLKKHYEKILLGVVLVLAIGAFASLPFLIGMERDKLETMRTAPNRPKIPEIPALDLATATNTLERLDSPIRWDLTKDHNTVNPVVWQKDAKGVIHKLRAGQELNGASALEVLAIRPLYLILTFNQVSGTNSYQIGFTNGAARGARNHGERLVTVNEKGDFFTLKKVVGPPDNPTELDLEMNDTLEPAVITLATPFKRIESYAADLKYPPDSRTYNDQRTNMNLTLSGMRYKIVAITRTNVTVAAPNDKKHTINLNVVP